MPPCWTPPRWSCPTALWVSPPRASWSQRRRKRESDGKHSNPYCKCKRGTKLQQLISFGFGTGYFSILVPILELYLHWRSCLYSETVTSNRLADSTSEAITASRSWSRLWKESSSWCGVLQSNLDGNMSKHIRASIKSNTHTCIRLCLDNEQLPFCQVWLGFSATTASSANGTLWQLTMTSVTLMRK